MNCFHHLPYLPSFISNNIWNVYVFDIKQWKYVSTFNTLLLVRSGGLSGLNFILQTLISKGI